jgi:hypothetical protein
MGRHKSEDVIINAPMSFAGAAQRAFRLRRVTFNPPLLANILMTTLAIFAVAVWWPLIAVWYVAFGLLLVPYRLLRRGSRKRKAESLRHREMMEALRKQEAGQ